MTYLLDSNAFIWWMADSSKLGRRARAAIADPSHTIYISNLSLFECGLKAKIGKLKIDFAAVDVEISEGRLLELRFDTLAARQLVDQPNLVQSDPFDAALVAQAIAKRMTLITSDHHILAAVMPGLFVIDARK